MDYNLRVTSLGCSGLDYGGSDIKKISKEEFLISLKTCMAKS